MGTSRSSRSKRPRRWKSHYGTAGEGNAAISVKEGAELLALADAEREAQKEWKRLAAEGVHADSSENSE